MFASSTTLPNNRMLSYETALSTYNSIKPIRGRQGDVRPLAARRNDNLTIRQEPTGDIVVRLYQTDIIRYNDGGVIVLNPYPSALTNRVVWSILAPHVSTHWSDRHYLLPDNVTEVGGRYYHTPEFATVQYDQGEGWVLTGGDKPFEVPRVNRREAKQALHDTGFYRFQTWLNTLIRLGADPRSERGRWPPRPFSWSPHEAMKYLTAGEDGWSEIAGRMSRRVDVRYELNSLRQAVYKSELCYDTETIPYFSTYGEMQAAFGRMRSYAVYKTYTDGRRPVCIKARVTLEYAQWWCSTREGYTYGRY